MLLLVAVANVPAWTGADGRLTQGGLQALSATFSTADSVWIFIRTLLVDERAIPLFALLFAGASNPARRHICKRCQAPRRGANRRRQNWPGHASRPRSTPAAWCAVAAGG